MISIAWNNSLKSEYTEQNFRTLKTSVMAQYK